MAQKFGNARWVKEGFLDNRMAGVVFGQITFAGLGPVEIGLKGDMRGEIAGRVIGLRNSAFLDDERAGEALFDFCCPQIGTVSLISFDPHPLLPPHPYVEWFSEDARHYRIELEPGDAWLMTNEELAALEPQVSQLQQSLMSRLDRL